MAEKKTKAPGEMTVEELEQESYKLNDEIQAIRTKAIEVQGWLGKRNEEARISQLLGRDVQIVNVPTVAVPEDTASANIPAEQQAGSFAQGE